MSRVKPSRSRSVVLGQVSENEGIAVVPVQPMETRPSSVLTVTVHEPDDGARRELSCDWM